VNAPLPLALSTIRVTLSPAATRRVTCARVLPLAPRLQPSSSPPQRRPFSTYSAGSSLSDVSLNAYRPSLGAVHKYVFSRLPAPPQAPSCVLVPSLVDAVSGSVCVLKSTSGQVTRLMLSSAAPCAPELPSTTTTYSSLASSLRTTDASLLVSEAAHATSAPLQLAEVRASALSKLVPLVEST
jgi:hypothetical protein